MWNSRFRFGRRRSRASFGVIACLVAVFFAIEYVKDEYQRRQEFSGTILRKYSALEYPGSKSYKLYWDIRDQDGEIRSPRIRPKTYWQSGQSGNRVMKRAGELYPTITG